MRVATSTYSYRDRVINIYIARHHLCINIKILYNVEKLLCIYAGCVEPSLCGAAPNNTSSRTSRTLAPRVHAPLAYFYFYCAHRNFAKKKTSFVTIKYLFVVRMRHIIYMVVVVVVLMLMRLRRLSAQRRPH